MLANRPLGVLDDDSVCPCRRRLGKSEAFRMVGLELSISDMTSIVDDFYGCSKDLHKCTCQIMLCCRIRYQMNFDRLAARNIC